MTDEQRAKNLVIKRCENCEYWLTSKCPSTDYTKFDIDQFPPFDFICKKFLLLPFNKGWAANIRKSLGDSIKND